MIELKRCPFCGAIPHIIKTNHQYQMAKFKINPRKVYGYIKCPLCLVQTPIIRSGRLVLLSTSIKNWNERSQ